MENLRIRRTGCREAAGVPSTCGHADKDRIKDDGRRRESEAEK